MKKTEIIILAAAVLIAGFLLFYRNRPPGEPLPVSPKSGRQTGSRVGEAGDISKYETKTDDQAGVVVAVTPQDLTEGSSEWKFNITMNTHSVELGHDLTKSAVLIDDRGVEHFPLRWEGSSGGHHREGVLVFNAVDPASSYVELKFKNIGGVPERSFKWSIK